MPRPLRVHMEGVLYYVTCRAEPGIPLFQDSRDTETYLDLLSQYKHQLGFRVYAFSLCAYELHLLLEVGAGATISQVMHALNSRYTKLYCKRYVHAGHLFQGRFRAVVAEKEPCLVPLIRFVHGQRDPLANSLSRYEGFEGGCQVSDLAPSWLDTLELEVEAGSWRMEAGSAEMGELRGSLQSQAIGSPIFLNEVKRRAAAAASAQAMASGPEEEEEEEEKLEEDMELVPVRIRRGWHRGGFLAAAMMAALVGLLSQRTLIPLESKVRVIVESQAAPARSSAQAVSEPAPLLAVMTPAPTQLNGTRWEIQIAPMYARNGTPIVQDQIAFEGNRISSKALSAQGFPMSNITLTPQEDGRLVWETMQTHPNGEMVFWRGELKEGRMQGIFSRRPAGDGPPQDFLFVGIPRPMADSERAL